MTIDEITFSRKLKHFKASWYSQFANFSDFDSMHSNIFMAEILIE